ncbi:hypothetical protein EWM64_g1934 [Hericium alpestre]|uniref:F-box domain-containing protein n=1 Tax=Hericium alpestre TaxID=135208 RepID=A0A4Z0A5T4_9AGAM|nr:hypothetical protein EWM64_g1934 [Hericium alpestre]
MNYDQWEDTIYKAYLRKQPEPTAPESEERKAELMGIADRFKERTAKIATILQSRTLRNVNEVERLIDSLAEARWKRCVILWRLFPFKQLPTEIVVKIFRQVAWSARGNAESNLALLRLTWVCRHWRHIALCDKALWNTIWFSESSPWTRSFTFFERAGTAPLSLRIGESNRFLETRDRNDILTREQMESLMDRILTKVEQITMLIISVEEWPAVYAALSKLRAASRARLLYRFEIHRLGRPYTWLRPEYETHEYLEASTLCGAEALALRYLCCNGVHLNWNRTPISNLQCLDLRRMPAQYSPSVERFFEILRSSPNLESLILDGGGPSWDDKNPHPEVPPVHLPHLATLIIGSFSLLLSTFLVKALDAPKRPRSDAHEHELQYMRVGGLKRHVLHAFFIDGRLHLMDDYPLIPTDAQRKQIEEAHPPIILLPKLKYLEYQSMDTNDVLQFGQFRKHKDLPLEKIYINSHWAAQMSKQERDLLRTVSSLYSMSPHSLAPECEMLHMIP